MYADFEEMSTYETGRVYVLFQGQDVSFIQHYVYFINKNGASQCEECECNCQLGYKFNY